jgi:hypothetical protein
VRSGAIDTGWLEREWSPESIERLGAEDLEAAVIAAAMLAEQSRSAPIASSASAEASTDGTCSAWRLAARTAALR